MAAGEGAGASPGRIGVTAAHRILLGGGVAVLPAPPVREPCPSMSRRRGPTSAEPSVNPPGPCPLSTVYLRSCQAVGTSLAVASRHVCIG